MNEVTSAAMRDGRSMLSNRRMAGFAFHDVVFFIYAVVAVSWMAMALTVRFLQWDNETRLKERVSQAAALVDHIRKQYPRGNYAGLSRAAFLAKPGTDPNWTTDAALSPIAMAPHTFPGPGQQRVNAFTLIYQLPMGECVEFATRVDSIAKAGLEIDGTWVRRGAQRVTADVLIDRCTARAAKTVSVQIATW